MSTNPVMSQCNLRREQNIEVTFGMRIWIKGHIKFHFPLKTFLCNQTNVVTPPMEQSFHHKHLGYKRDVYGWFCLPKTNYIGTNSGLYILVQDFFFFLRAIIMHKTLFSPNFNLKYVSFFTHAYINVAYLGT